MLKRLHFRPPRGCTTHGICHRYCDDGTAAQIGASEPMLLLGRGGCPPLLNVPGRYARGCNDVWKRFVSYAREVRPPVVVVVGGGSPLLQGQIAALAVHGMPFPMTQGVFEEGLRTLLLALQENSTVIYVREIPRFESDPSCFLRRISLPGNQCSPSIARRAIEAKMATYNRAVDNVRASLPRVTVVDSIVALCDATCMQKLPSGAIIYSDKMHLSAAGGKYFAQRSALPNMVLGEIHVARDVN